MSPLTRTLLALAAAALLHAATADGKCTTAKGGTDGDFGNDVKGFHLDRTDSVSDLPANSCPGDPKNGKATKMVGVVVTACDPFGNAPAVQLLAKDQRVRVTCDWTSGTSCPLGIDVSIQQRCQDL